MFGEHSLFQRPDLHRRRKAAVQPAFAGAMLKGYLPRGSIGWSVATYRLGVPTASCELFPAVEELPFDVLARRRPLGVNVEEGDQALSRLPNTTKSDLRRPCKRFSDGFFGLLR